MNAEPTPPLSQIPDQEIQEALVLLFSLSNASVESINELMRGSAELRFADAAMHAGVITREQLEEALDWIQRKGGHEGGGIVEEVLRRNVQRRKELVLWEGPQLTPGPQLIVAHDPHTAHSEAIRSLSSDLLIRTRNKGGGILALMSPCAGEGRSQLAAELAIAFAQLGRRTLLVDADLRHPRQHLLFGADNETGLAQALVDGGSVRLHGIANLPQMKLLTSGALPPNPLELLSGIRFEHLTFEWRRSFEFVILDTPPASESSDAIAVASAVGNVLVLSRAGVTPFSLLKEMTRKLETSHARTLGGVINRF